MHTTTALLVRESEWENFPTHILVIWSIMSRRKLLGEVLGSLWIPPYVHSEIWTIHLSHPFYREERRLEKKISSHQGKPACHAHLTRYTLPFSSDTLLDMWRFANSYPDCQCDYIYLIGLVLYIIETPIWTYLLLKRPYSSLRDYNDVSNTSTSANLLLEYY